MVWVNRGTFIPIFLRILPLLADCKKDGNALKRFATHNDSALVVKVLKH